MADAAEGRVCVVLDESTKELSLKPEHVEVLVDHIARMQEARWAQLHMYICSMCTPRRTHARHTRTYGRTHHAKMHTKVRRIDAARWRILFNVERPLCVCASIQ